MLCYSWKELLPVLLEVLEEEKYINHKNGEVSGSKYKSIIINNICDSEWNTQIMPSLARMFRYAFSQFSTEEVNVVN